MSDKKVVDVILHCQKQIKKDRLPEEKLLHYLGRLSRLRITVHELAETGIGRTVNSLSRNEGPVGQAADTLVRGWKRMVSEQQNQADQESEEESDSNSGTSEEDEETRKCDDEESFDLEHATQPETAQAHQFSSSQSSADDGRESIGPDGNAGYDDGGDDDIDDIDDPYMENGFLNMANVHTDEEEEEEDDDEENDSDGSDRLQIADEGQNGRHVIVKQEVIPKQENDYYDDGLYDSSQEKDQVHQRSRENGDRKQNYEPNLHAHQTERADRSYSSQSSSSSKESSRKEHRHHSSKSKEETKDRSNKHGDHHHKSHSHHHSSSKSDKPKESKSEHNKSHKDKEKHRSKEHREKHKEVRSPEKDRKSEKDKRESSSHHHVRDKGQDAGSSHSPKKSSLDSRKHENNEEKKRNEERKRRDEDNESSHHSSKKSKVTYKEEIDSTSGINFADALGCLDTSSSKHKKPKREEPEKLNNRHESHAHGSSSSHSHKSEFSKKHESSKHSRDKPSSSSSKYSEKESDRKSKSKAQSKIESVIQPTVNISPNYKPVNSSLATIPRPSNSTNGFTAPISITQADLADIGPEFYENSRGNFEVSQEDAISTMLSNRNRNARSKVYSGVKSARHGLVPSLFDQCMQVIKDNIGDLGYTGGIPYDILKPALERANPQQLMNIEAQNDYLIGETDELWQFHCKRDFRGKFPDETESWRELYERCKEEQQLRFEKIKKQMKRSIASAEPVRKAKLAYVDTSCGPRFNLAKAKTIKDGMKTLKIKEEKGPGRGVSSSASAGFNNPKKSTGGDNVKVEEASCIIAPDSRSGHAPAPPVSRESVAAKLKPKKAPLMQKTMKLIRSLNRR